MANYTKGKVVRGIVTGIETYGIFVSLDEYYTGLIHISEISYNFVKDIHDFVKIGDTINVKIIGVDSENFHLKLSIKDINYKIREDIKKRKIIETPLGSKTLFYKLPIWINENLKKIEKTQK